MRYQRAEFPPFFGPTFDFADTVITITHAQSGHSSGTFNGYKFFDVLSTIDAFVGVSILSDSTGFFSANPSRVSFDSDNIFVNFESLTFIEQSEPTITLSVQFQSTQVPEPASLALLGVGLAGLGFMRRRRT